MGLGHLECVPYQHSELTTGTFSSFNLTSTSCGFLRKRDGAGGSCQSHIQMVPTRLHPVPPTFCCDLLDSFFQGLTESAPSVDRMWYYLFVSGMAAMPCYCLS